LRVLESRRLARRLPDDAWALTPEGLREAEARRSTRSSTA
jgi:hypothetical protein